MDQARHVAIIMDGNGRWARQQGKSRRHGHREGVKALERTARAAADSEEIKYLTVFAFSTENWKRPGREVKFLFDLLRSTIRNELDKLQEDEQIKVQVIGRLEELDPDIQEDIKRIERISRDNKELVLTVAVNYGGRAEIIDAVNRIIRKNFNQDLLQNDEEPARENLISESELAENLYRPDLPEVDLLIRTGGEQRISNFLLWQISYAELYFTQVLWPDFGADDLKEALQDYTRRQRKFGGLPGEENRPC